MIALLLTLACSPPPPVSCPNSTISGGGGAAGEAGWWHLEDLGVEGLRAAWPFRAFDPMGEGDEALWCEGGGQTRQRRGAAGTVVGELDASLRPVGSWTGTWENTGAVAFTGAFVDGEPAGAWVFYDPSGGEVGGGMLAAGRPHGLWRVVEPKHTTEARYVFGVLHGDWVQTQTDGSRVEGRYFDGRRNYEWDYLDSDGTVVLREAWKYGTFVARWDPRSDPNPLPGKQLPGDKLGPNAEGICKVHATCATNAFLTVMLTGHATTAAEAAEVPVLVDYADGVAPSGQYERVLLVDEYNIDHVQAGIGATEAVATVSFDARCTVSPDGTLEPAHGTEVLELELRDRDGVWKIASPLPTLYVRVDAWIDRHPDRAQEAMRLCGEVL